MKTKDLLLCTFVVALASLFSFAQIDASKGRISGVVKDPDQAVIAGTPVILTGAQNQVKLSTVTNDQGAYTFSDLPPGRYVVEADAKGFRPSVSAELQVAAGQTVTCSFLLTLAEALETVNVTAGAVENAYRVENVKPGGPLGNTPILDLPYSVYVISRQLIDDTQSRNFKEAAKYLPAASYQEMQGPEVLRPESRGMQGSNMQNDLKDGMGIAVTTPTALEEYEQIEVVTGVAAPLYGPANPSGMFNFITKRPTDEQFREIELGYESATVGTAHADLGGRLGPNKMFGYRTNLVIADGSGYVTDSQLRRQLAAVALDVHPFAHTTIEGNFSYYNLFQHGYPGWFAYAPTTTPPSVPGSKSILLPADAPDPTRRGYGQSFAGVDLTNQIGEVRVKHDFSYNWHLIVGVLHQTADRNINTPVNSLTDNAGDYQTYLENTFQNSLAPRFQVKSDLAYLIGKFRTWGVTHDVVIGSNGYRFATYQPVVDTTLNPSLKKTALCPQGQAVCHPSIADPLIDVPPATGIPSYTKTATFNGIYVNNIIHQQGFSLDDTITLTPHWLLRVAASQDWTWVNTYNDSKATGYRRVVNPQGNNSMFQGVSPTGSVIYKPRVNMTIYGTFVESIQPPDVATAATAPAITVNANQVLAPYRSKEGEVGYKLKLRRIDFSTAWFRIERPFATYVGGIVDPICAQSSGTANCQALQIVGNQVNYGVESALSGRLFQSLMVTGGLVVLNPKLTDTHVAATNDKTFVGIPDYKSNVLAEYHLPILNRLYFNFDWEHVGRRPIDDINSSYTPQFNLFDLGLRYTAKVFRNVTTWRVAVDNVSDVHYWSTIGPGSITGASTGSYLGHLGEPRLVTASMRYDF